MTVLEHTATADERAHVRAAWRARRRRTLVVTIALALAGAIAFCVELAVGDYPIPFLEVVPALFGQGDGGVGFIIFEHRLPRAAAAVLVGAAFGLSGAVFQSLARNPLASPDIIGITAGSAVSAVFLILVLQLSGIFLSAGTLVGALLVATVIYLLAYRRGIAPMRMVLIGIAVGFFCEALISFLFSRARIYDVQRATQWLTGSLGGLGWDEVIPLFAFLLVLVPSVLMMARPLRTIQLGEATATGLGVKVELSRTGLFVLAVGLAAVATAAAGPVAFVAFVAGPIARRLTGTSLTLVPAALTGAVLLLVSDVIARTMFAPIQLPVGVVTAIIGAPYLIYLLSRTYRGREG